MLGVALPTGLQAKALVDWCMLPGEEQQMAADHSCCPTDRSNENRDDGTSAPDSRHDCDWNLICTCHIDRAPLSDEQWTLPSVPFTDLRDGTTDVPVPQRDDDPSENLTAALPPSSTPLYLLNGSFLN